MRYDGNGKPMVQTPQSGEALRKMFERQSDEEWIDALIQGQDDE